MTSPRILAVGEEFPAMTSAPPTTRLHPGEPKGPPAAVKAKAGDRFALLNTFVDFGLAGLSRAEVAVWLVLYRDSRDGTARTSYDDLARRGGLNRRSVGRALRSLEGRGMVKAIRKGGLGRGPSSYRLRGTPKDG